MTKQLEITRYPVYTTYGKMGLSQDDIDTDTVYTIYRQYNATNITVKHISGNFGYFEYMCYI